MDDSPTQGAPRPGRAIAPLSPAGAGEAPGSLGAPVLVVGARAADAQVLVTALTEAGAAARAVADVAAAAALIEGAGCVVAAQEGLTPEAVTALSRALTEQPSWSELPVIVLIEPGVQALPLRRALQPEWGEAQLTMLVRPVPPLTLTTTVNAALSSRMRQFLLRDQLAQEAELRRELNHRVKNILVTVQAMARMTARSSAGAGDEASTFAAFERRLSALSTVHGHLFDAPDEAAAFGPVACAVLAPWGVVDAGRVRLEAPGRPLDPEAAKLLAMCAQELVTNALKHGALSTERGVVDLSLTLEGDRARLCWRESGGPPARPPARRGYGMRYLAGALSGLFGAPPDLSFAPEGFRLEVEGPAAPLLGG